MGTLQWVDFEVQLPGLPGVQAVAVKEAGAFVFLGLRGRRGFSLVPFSCKYIPYVS